MAHFYLISLIDVLLIFANFWMSSFNQLIFFGTVLFQLQQHCICLDKIWLANLRLLYWWNYMIFFSIVKTIYIFATIVSLSECNQWSDSSYSFYFIYAIREADAVFTAEYQLLFWAISDFASVLYSVITDFRLLTRIIMGYLPLLFAAFLTHRPKLVPFVIYLILSFNLYYNIINP